MTGYPTAGLVAAFLASVFLPGTALGQAYPTKPVSVVIGFRSGGGTDFLARQLADRMKAGLGQPVIVVNRPGGNLVIAAETVSKSAPDGHTLFLSEYGAIVLNPLLFTKLPYDPERDFLPISQVATNPFFVVAGPRAPAKNLRDLIAYAGKNPGKLAYGTTSSLAMLTGEQLKMISKVDMLYVPYKSSNQTLQALLSGQIDFLITIVMPYATYVKQGKLFGLATLGQKREFMLPDTPTAREIGYSELEFANFTGLFAPAGTPGAIIDKLNAEVRKAWSDPATVQRLAEQGIVATAGSPEELRAMMKSGVERWSAVIRTAGIGKQN